MNATDDNVALLVDVAHLKVSSDSEGFCKNRYLEITSEFTLAYHLSENDGRSIQMKLSQLILGFGHICVKTLVTIL